MHKLNLSVFLLNMYPDSRLPFPSPLFLSRYNSCPKQLKMAYPEMMYPPAGRCDQRIDWMTRSKSGSGQRSWRKTSSKRNIINYLQFFNFPSTAGKALCERNASNWKAQDRWNNKEKNVWLMVCCKNEYLKMGNKKSILFPPLHYEHNNNPMWNGMEFFLRILLILCYDEATDFHLVCIFFRL